MIFNAPEGVFGNPYAITHCTSSDFALDQCPSNSQAGLITVYANYEGESALPARHRADLRPRTARANRRRCFAFIVPTLNIPINIPVAVRTGGDYGLRFTVQDITQLTPLAGADLTFWGFPARRKPRRRTLPQRRSRRTRQLPRTRRHHLPRRRRSRSSIPVHPLTDNPTTCTGAPLDDEPRTSRPTRTPPIRPPRAEAATRRPTDCDLEVFNPVLYASPTTDGDRLALRPQHRAERAPVPRLRRLAVGDQNGDRHPARQASRSTPTPPTGRRPAPTRRPTSAPRARRDCPDNSKIGTFPIGTQALPRPLDGSVYIGEPKPGDQYRLFLIASGFGINAKLVGSFRPDPQTGQLTAYFEDLPQVPFDDFQLHLFSSDRGLMATPTHCTIYTIHGPLLPLEHDPGRTGIEPGLQPRLRPPRHATARARSARSTRASSPAPRIPTPAPSAPSP